MLKSFPFVIISATFALAACDANHLGNTEYKDKTSILLTANEPFVFGEGKNTTVVSKGQSVVAFPLLDGKYFAQIQVSSLSAPVAPLISIPNNVRYGIELDEDYCSTGVVLLDDIGIVVRHTEWNGNRVDPDICFSA